MTKKGAANFVRWKFLEDLREEKVRLETVVLSHPDADHYGGLLDLFSGRLPSHARFEVEVGRFFHSGIPRFAAAPTIGGDEPGTVAPVPHDRGLDRRREVPLGAARRRRIVRGAAAFARPGLRSPGQLSGAGACHRGPALGPRRSSTRIRSGRRARHDQRPRPGRSRSSPRDGSGCASSARMPLPPTGTPWFFSSSTGRRASFSPATSTPRPRSCSSLPPRRGLRRRRRQGLPPRLGGRAHRLPPGDAAPRDDHLLGDNEDYAHPRPALMGASARFGRESHGRHPVGGASAARLLDRARAGRQARLHPLAPAGPPRRRRDRARRRALALPPAEVHAGVLRPRLRSRERPHATANTSSARPVRSGPRTST